MGARTPALGTCWLSVVGEDTVAIVRRAHCSFPGAVPPNACIPGHICSDHNPAPQPRHLSSGLIKATTRSAKEGRGRRAGGGAATAGSARRLAPGPSCQATFPLTRHQGAEPRSAICQAGPQGNGSTQERANPPKPEGPSAERVRGGAYHTQGLEAGSQEHPCALNSATQGALRFHPAAQ